MCSKQYDYLYCVKLSIKAEEQTKTNFGRADDRLSRAVSELVKCNRDWSEAARLDTGFDGGEFSQGACYKGMIQEMLEIIHRYGFTVETLNNALRSSVSERSIYWDLGFILLEA